MKKKRQKKEKEEETNELIKVKEHTKGQKEIKENRQKKWRACHPRNIQTDNLRNDKLYICRKNTPKYSLQTRQTFRKYKHSFCFRNLQRYGKKKNELRGKQTQMLLVEIEKREDE